MLRVDPERAVPLKEGCVTFSTLPGDCNADLGRGPPEPWGQGPHPRNSGETRSGGALPPHGAQPPYQTGRPHKREINCLV